ncbi:MAG: ATP-binding cassette domain-containing protein [Streptosporangiales bacterium]|nr:ATP-binding cassette domain-containing protein [Streptosporangiales bacterium]
MILGEVHAVCGVSFTVRQHETLGLVGESGCGKTTTARVVLGLRPASSGSVLFNTAGLAGTGALDSALDLLKDLQEELGLSYLFVSHDLSVVRHVAHRVAVMYLGRIVEIGPAEQIYERPAHPYTQALITAIPIPDPDKERYRRRVLLTGDVPSAVTPPSGCRFRTRCPNFASELTDDQRRLCAEEAPQLVRRGTAAPVACHYAEERRLLTGIPPT